MEHEEPLAGGVANAGSVVRVGPHVLRPSNPHTASIHRFLSHLASAGFEGAPVPVGINPDGRERLGFIEGDVALPPYPAWAQSDRSLTSTAALIKQFHAASRGFDATGCSWSDEMADTAGGGSVLCHNDVCLENVVFRDGVAIALLDFDFAAPGRPACDLANFARMCVPIDDEDSAALLGWAPADRPSRLRLVADAYGLDLAERRQLVEVIDASIAASGAFVRRRVEAGDLNFKAMWEAIGGQERFDRRRRWWVEHRLGFVNALT